MWPLRCSNSLGSLFACWQLQSLKQAATLEGGHATTRFLEVTLRRSLEVTLRRSLEVTLGNSGVANVALSSLKGDIDMTLRSGAGRAQLLD